MMIIVHAIRQSDNERAIYALLNAYLEAEPLVQNPNGARYFPIESTATVLKQMRVLFVAAGVASRRLDDHSRVIIKEAMYVFGAALDRLQSLTGRESKGNCAFHGTVSRRGGASHSLAGGSSSLLDLDAVELPNLRV